MTNLKSTSGVDFADERTMIWAAENEVRKEARRHPDDPWTPDRDRRWDEKIERSNPARVATADFTAAVVDARKRLRGELLAWRIDEVVKAANYRDRCEALGEIIPQRILNVLAWAAEPEKFTKLYFPENDDAQSVDDALSALARALH